MRYYAFPYIYRDIRLKSVVSNPCIQRPRINPCYGILRPGEPDLARWLADFTMRLLVLYRAECPETTAALSAPCPASYSTVPHPLTSSAASHPTPCLHPTSPYLYLCPISTSPRVRLRVRAVSRPSARRQLINIPNALPYRIRVPFFTVLYWPRPASSAPALFILVLPYTLPRK